MNVETVTSSSDSDAHSSLLQDTGVIMYPSRVEEQIPGTAPVDATAGMFPPHITTYNDDEIEIHSPNSTLTGPPTSHFRNQPTDDHSDSSSLPDDPIFQDNESSDEEELRSRFDRMWDTESDDKNSSQSSVVMRSSIFDDPITPKKKSKEPPQSPPPPPPPPPSPPRISTPAQRRMTRTSSLNDDSDATPIMQSPKRPPSDSPVRNSRATQSRPSQKKETSTAKPMKSSMTNDPNIQSSERKSSTKNAPKTSDERKSSKTNTPFPPQGKKPSGSAFPTTKPKPSVVAPKPSVSASALAKDKKSQSRQQQSKPKSSVVAPEPSSALAKDKSQSRQRQSKPKTSVVTPEPYISVSAPAKDKSSQSRQRQRNHPKENGGRGVQKPQSPTSVVKGPDSLADDSWESHLGQRSTSHSEPRRQSRLPSSSRDKSKSSEMDSSQTTPSASITMRPTSFSQIPISSDMTPAEWNIAQQQIQFLESELDKVTALCLELTQSVEEEEKVDTDRPSEDRLRTQQQVRYLAQELDTVSGLCDMLTKTAQESTDAIETLEEEKAKLDSLIKRLEKALSEKDAEATMKDKAIVEENESTCCGYCCNWIPEPIVWFISYIYRLD
jgi:hypothetical protein